MIDTMTIPWERAIRPSSSAGRPKSKGVIDLPKEDLVIEILRLRQENRILKAQLELAGRWCHEYAEHTELCSINRGLRCSCGLGVFIDGPS